jgi:ribose-phosphate pyrophosphokinase
VSASLCAFPGNEGLAELLRVRLACGMTRLHWRRFPDGESYVRFEDAVAGRDLVLVCSLNDPDAKAQALLFAAGTARELGAASVGLVAPYLGYMRQDRRFREGEAVTSALFAAQLSAAFDWLVTVDAHLHRRRSLSEIYSIPARDVGAAGGVSEWIRANVERPLVVGPDAESERWAAAVAAGAGAPHVALKKVRSGDRDVRIEAPGLDAWRGRNPVLVDDIISTARTMAAAARLLIGQGFAPPACVGVHGVFAGDALEVLRAAGAAQIVSSNTIAHETNAIDVGAPVAQAVAAMLSQLRSSK